MMHLRSSRKRSEFECLKIQGRQTDGEEKGTLQQFFRIQKGMLSCEDAKHTERELYGNIYHNLATAYVQLIFV